MACCTGEEHSNWCKYYDIVYVDAEGKEYCIFHAPAEHKYSKPYVEGEGERPGLMAGDAFNELVFAHILKCFEPNDYLDIHICSIAGTIFHEYISFSTFNGKENPKMPNILFSNCRFPEGVSFSGTKFKELAHFTGCVFSNKTDFEKSQFHSDVLFNACYFKNNSNFKGVQFRNTVTFVDSQFQDKTNFQLTQFRGKAYFQSTHFWNTTDFRGCQFRSRASFRGSIFLSAATFVGSQFRKDVDFALCHFSTVLFNNAKSKGICNFHCSTFDGVSFFEMTFEDAVFFNNVEFYENAIFSRTIFKQISNFIKTKFHKKADFKQTFFQEWSYFRKVTFNSKTSFSAAITKEKILIDSTNLSNFHFTEVNIELFKFIDCKWGDEKFAPVYDETHQKELETTDEQLEEIYRRLKKVSRDSSDEMQTSHWHYKEKEFQRKIVNDKIPFSTHWISYIMVPALTLLSFWALTKYKLSMHAAFLIYLTVLSPFVFFCYNSLTNSGKCFSKHYLNIYNLSSGYGEKPEKALGVLALILVINAMIVATPILPSLSPVKQSMPPVDFISSCLWYLPLSKIEAYPTSGWNSFWRLIMNLTITIQAALFAFALRNKLRR
ncbi:hypothetical protein D0S45_14390 [Marinifilum sp. JC120]|nr:hypothetical protein D0S45_14390 [Marinifilum sp. JC120]